METLQIYLNSINADTYFNGLTSDCEFILPSIDIPDGYQIFLSVNHATIPYSFYNINNTNNYISLYDLVNLTYSNYTIPIGNYNINQLLNLFNSNLTGYTFTYNNINNKITITHINNFQIMNTSTCSQLIGFQANTITTSYGTSLTSINCIDLFPFNVIYIQSNLLTYNINKSSANNQSILCAIPVYSQPYSIIQYTNYNNFRCNLFSNNLYRIAIKLIDEYGKSIDLNGCHFNLSLQIEIVKFTE
jgi:hypothetical protein